MGLKAVEFDQLIKRSFYMSFHLQGTVDNQLNEIAIMLHW